MFGLGMGEILIILIFALIFIGPKKLPGMAKNLGKGLREFQKAKQGIFESMHDDEPEPETAAKPKTTTPVQADEPIEPEYHEVSEEDFESHNEMDQKYTESADDHLNESESEISEHKDKEIENEEDKTDQEDKKTS